MQTPDPVELRGRLLEVIGRGAAAELGDAEFESLALDVFRHQFACNRPYRAYCESRGATPESVTRWTEVPAVPTDAFKAAPLVCGDPARARAVFRTSGTTGGSERRGTHYFPELGLYDAALRAGFAAHLLPDGARLPVLSLVPPAASLPDSSLSHMIAEVRAAFGAEGSDDFVSTDGGIELQRLTETLRTLEAEDRPVLLVGTSFAFVHLFDALRERGQRMRLPEGSRAMDTGGFKGRSREVPRAELYATFAELLGVPARWVVNEYGMTEMSSQFYDTTAGTQQGEQVEGRLHRGPAWVRTRAVDPETLEALPHGELGVLRHWDLANLGSVMALQTADLGRVLPGGIELRGRARGAEARGCSIAMDELLTVLGRR